MAFATLQHICLMCEKGMSSQRDNFKTKIFSIIQSEKEILFFKLKNGMVTKDWVSEREAFLLKLETLCSVCKGEFSEVADTIRDSDMISQEIRELASPFPSFFTINVKRIK